MNNVVVGVIALLLASCSGRRSQLGPVRPDPSVAPADQAETEADPTACDNAIKLMVNEPSPKDIQDGHVALLTASFGGAGVGMRANRICLLAKSGNRLVDDTLQTQIRAHPTELQRLIIDGTIVLLRVPPGRQLRIRYHDCVDWALGGDWFDPGTMEPGPLVKYGRAGRSCEPGFVHGGPIHEADDPRCRNQDACQWHRCVRSASISLSSQLSGARALWLLDGKKAVELGEEAQEIPPYGGLCPHLSKVKTVSEEALIAPGLGEHWLVAVDRNGRLSGTVSTVEATH